MLFHEFPFLYVFLPATLLAFFISRTLATRFSVLAIASLTFYAAEKPIYLILLIASILINFALALKIGKDRTRGNLILAIAFNLGLLGVFKYYNFFVDQLDFMTGVGLNLSIVLPIGISFYTFQQIAYQVDVYRGDTAYKDLIKYTVFVTFFPQLIAGPIVHHREMMPQFETLKKFSSSNLAIGLCLLTIGLVKKVVIADTMASFATPVFTAAETSQLSTMAAWSGSLAYSMQIYFDFSGYSDMALGLARLFGIRLPVNFNMPYRAMSIIEFWRRWHMTLSRFLRDYLYIPLGGSRLGTPRRWLNLMATMLLGGLWHGASWTFVVWGGLHGLFLAINHAWHVRASSKLMQLPGYSAAAWALTFIAIVHAWVFFRALSFTGALTILKAMWGLQSGPADPIGPVQAAPFIKFTLLGDELSPIPYDGYAMTFFIPLFVISLLLSTRRTNSLTFGRQLGCSIRTNSSLANIALAMGVISVFYFIGILTSYGASEFLYFQF